MVNKPLIRPCFLVGVALGGAARIPLIYIYIYMLCVYCPPADESGDSFWAVPTNVLAKHRLVGFQFAMCNLFDACGTWSWVRD